MITASHNPKNDNGYKLYWGNGCQIIPPIDKKIANAILDNLKPWNWNPELATQSIDPESSLKSFDLGASKVSFCYTAMHGVGYPFAKKAFEVFGLGSKLVPVLEQVKKKFIMKRLILILNFQLLYIPIRKKRVRW
jgi:phosphoglucomutase